MYVCMYVCTCTCIYPCITYLPCILTYIYLYPYLYICLFIYLSSYPSSYLSIHLSIHLSIYLSICPYRSVSLLPPSTLFKRSDMTEKWIRRDISNFEYLMFINTAAGITLMLSYCVYYQHWHEGANQTINYQKLPGYACNLLMHIPSCLIYLVPCYYGSLG